jgi:hypothetical protein
MMLLTYDAIGDCAQAYDYSDYSINREECGIHTLEPIR